MKHEDEPEGNRPRPLPEPKPLPATNWREEHDQIVSRLQETILVYKDRCHESPLSEGDIRSFERSLTNMVAIALWHHAEGRSKDMRDVLVVVEQGRSLLDFNWFMHGSVKSHGANSLLPGPDSEEKNQKDERGGEKWE